MVVVGRDILVQIDHAARQGDDREESELARIGLGLGEIHQVDIGREHQIIDRRVARGAHAEEGVDTRSLQRRRRVFAPEGDEGGIAAVNAIGGEKLQGRGARPAAVDADGDTPAAQGR